MRLISSNAALSTQLKRLAQTYPNISFAVAWATANTPFFRQLLRERDRIQKAVIGTHFYQTHPEVLEAFTGSTRVRFMLQPKGVFHPKLYVFWSTTEWEALIGSANLTFGALNTNSEVMALLGGRITDPLSVQRDMLSCIDLYWSQAVPVTSKSAKSYRSIWESQKPVLKRLSASYGGKPPTKSPVESSVMSLPWNKFLAAVGRDREHSLEGRCDLLQLVREAFEQHNHFSSMAIGLRKTIAGLPTNFDPRWAWFGSMKGSGYFHQAVNCNNAFLSRALDAIPSTGVVNRLQYDRFIAAFRKAFPHGRDGVATATRLLALKRPDQFVCVDTKNLDGLCADFGIVRSGVNYERYWSEIVERILDSPWWNSPRPSQRMQQRVWDGRAALLDVIFYSG